MDAKKELFKNKPTFKQFYTKNKNKIKPIKDREEKPIEYQYLNLLHKLDGLNFDYMNENEIDDFIEELLLED